MKETYDSPSGQTRRQAVEVVLLPWYTLVVEYIRAGRAMTELMVQMAKRERLKRMSVATRGLALEMAQYLRCLNFSFQVFQVLTGSAQSQPKLLIYRSATAAFSYLSKAMASMVVTEAAMARCDMKFVILQKSQPNIQFLITTIFQSHQRLQKQNL